MLYVYSMFGFAGVMYTALFKGFLFYNNIYVYI